MKEKWIMFIKEDGKIIIQEAEYIEDGFYIEIDGAEITLFEIPQFGGEVSEIGKFTTIIDAINFSKTLT